MKTTIFNLIILDESGSMEGMRSQTISGCNETLNTIRATKEKHGENLKSFVSIYAFQSDGKVPSRYIVKNATPENVNNITEKDYEPWGATPLLDAVGSTLTELMAIAQTHEDAMGIVTIMTDGYENSSTQYTWKKVAELISKARELGWTVNLIGANIDVEKMAKTMNIDSSNAMAYQQTEDGTVGMWNQFNNCVSEAIDNEVFYCSTAAPETQQQRSARRKSSSRSFFKRK